MKGRSLQLTTSGFYFTSFFLHLHRKKHKDTWDYCLVLGETTTFESNLKLTGNSVQKMCAITNYLLCSQLIVK